MTFVWFIFGLSAVFHLHSTAVALETIAKILREKL